MTEFRQAIARALELELEQDEDVVFFGEDVAAAGGVFKATTGLHERFGDRRVFDTPISELALAGAAYGAALGGLRPVIEIMFGDFMALPMDSLVNQAAKFRYLSQDRVRVPLVVRTAVGGGGRFGAIHSQIPASWFQGVPGLRIAAPAFPADAFGLLRAAIRDNDPVLFLEHKTLYSFRADYDESAEMPPVGKGRVVRPGSDLTIAATMRSVHEALVAADELAGDGIDAEVTDLRWLRPLDVDLILASVRKTNRLVVIEEGPLLGGWGANLAGIISVVGLEELDDVAVVTCPDSPIPFSPPLEDAYLPGSAHIERAVRSRLGLAPALAG